MLARLKFNITELVNEILDHIPEDVIINGTMLDPAMGGGQFVREVERRKREAGKTDQEIRDTVFGYEENILRRDYAVNKYDLKGNYTVDNFLERDFKDMKFDVVVGNPPFQSAESSLNLWPLFVEKSLSILTDDGHLGFITPTSWMRPSTDIKRTADKGGSKYIFKDFMKVYNTKTIDTASVEQYFNVGSSFSYYIIQKSPYSGKTSVKCKDGVVDVDLSNFVLFPQNADSIVVSIFEKLQSKDNKFNFKGKRNDSRDHLDYSLSSTSVNKYMYVGSQYNKTKFNESLDAMIYYTSERHPDHDKPKIVVNYIGDIKPYVDDGNSGFQYCQVHFLNSVAEVDPAKSVVKSKLFRLAYKFVRFGMHNEAGVLNSLSYPPLTKVYTDADLYNYFNLSQEEIDYVEANS